MSTLWRHKFFIKWSMTSKVIQGHMPQIILAHLFMDRFWWKFVWILISWIIYDLTCMFDILEKYVFFTWRPSDLIKTFTCVLMDNFYPCFFSISLIFLCFSLSLAFSLSHSSFFLISHISPLLFLFISHILNLFFFSLFKVINS